jgi:hypothetical protein
MAHLRGLSDLGVLVNSKHLGEWPQKLGLYMLNFAGIELISYQYLNELEPTRASFEENLTRLLGARIDRILELTAAASITETEKAEVRDAWLEAKELAVWRNRIAHNPVLPTWKPDSDSDRDPPDLFGIPDMRQIKGSNIADSISLPGSTASLMPLTQAPNGSMQPCGH